MTGGLSPRQTPFVPPAAASRSWVCPLRWTMRVWTTACASSCLTLPAGTRKRRANRSALRRQIPAAAAALGGQVALVRRRAWHGRCLYRSADALDAGGEVRRCPLPRPADPPGGPGDPAPHRHNFPPLSAANHLRLAHELYPFQYPPGPIRSYWRRIERRTIGRTDLVLTVNESVAAELRGSTACKLSRRSTTVVTSSRSRQRPTRRRLTASFASTESPSNGAGRAFSSTVRSRMDETSRTLRWRSNSSPAGRRSIFWARGL